MSNSTNGIETYHRGDSICRRTDWVDVAKFFLLNYGLHAVTVLTEPGSTTLASILASFTAVMLPSGGVARALRAVLRFAIWGTTDLEVALRSEALCMLVPADLPASSAPLRPTNSPEAEGSEKRVTKRLQDAHLNQPMSNDPDKISRGPRRLNSSEETALKDQEQELQAYWRKLKNTFFPIPADLTQVHGEYPKDVIQPPRKLKEGAAEEGGAEGQSHHKYILIDVPRHFHVCGLVGPLRTEDRYELIMDWFEKCVTKLKRTDGQGESGTPAPTTGFVANSEPEGKSTARLGPGEPTVALPVGNAAPGPAKPVEIRISCNYSFVKSVAAIIQIVYGSLELYKIGKDQIEQHGYTTYQLTVIPYIFMSLANLIASLTGPRYPSKYLVHYRGLRRPSTGEGEGDLYPPGWWGDEDREQVERKISGVVGQAYGSFLKSHEQSLEERVIEGYSAQAPEIHLMKRVVLQLHKIFALLFALVFLVGPYVTIYLLAGYRAGNSTISQQRWIACWYAFGYAGQSFLGFLTVFPKFRKFRINNPRLALVIITTWTALLSIPTIGGLVVVAQMMMHENTCKIL